MFITYYLEVVGNNPLDGNNRIAGETHGKRKDLNASINGWITGLAEGTLKSITGNQQTSLSFEVAVNVCRKVKNNH